MNNASVSLYSDGAGGAYGTYYPGPTYLLIDGEPFDLSNASGYPASVTLVYVDDTVTVTPTSFDFTLTGLDPGTYGVEISYGQYVPDPPTTMSATFRGSATIVCTCNPEAKLYAINRTDSGYSLVVELSVGDCSGPLTDIEWTPAPSSGQGTMRAVYDNRRYNQLYEGTVAAIDQDDCEASVDFSFQWTLGTNPPSC